MKPVAHEACNDELPNGFGGNSPLPICRATGKDGERVEGSVWVLTNHDLNTLRSARHPFISLSVVHHADGSRSYSMRAGSANVVRDDN